MIEAYPAAGHGVSAHQFSSITFQDIDEKTYPPAMAIR